jgi:hypothetical protein
MIHGRQLCASLTPRTKEKPKTKDFIGANEK